MTAAGAADMAVKAPAYAPPPPAAASWTGCYVDAGWGYGLWSQDSNMEVNGGAVTLTNNNGGRGWLGQVGAGCDYQVAPRWIVGLLGDYNFMNLHGSVVDQFDTEQANERQSGAWAFGARIGYVLTPNVLTYANFGFTQARFDQMEVISPYTGAPFGEHFPGHTYNGWFLGSGFETSLSSWLPALPNGLFLRSEYRFASYGSADLPELIDATGASDDGESIHSRKYVQTVTTSVVWRFNWAGPRW
jgi:outer membrane immunogenic protein